MLKVNWYRRTLLLGSLLAAFMIAAAAPALAQNAGDGASPPVRLGIVDWERILQISEVGKSVQEQLKQKRNQYSQDQKNRLDALRTEHESLMKQRTLMAQEAFQQKLQALEQKRQSLQSEAEKRSNQLYRAQQTSLAEIQTALARICQEHMEANNLTLVVKKSDTVLFINQYDFTEEALAKLNQQLPSMTVTFPPLQ